MRLDDLRTLDGECNLNKHVASGDQIATISNILAGRGIEGQSLPAGEIFKYGRIPVRGQVNTMTIFRAQVVCRIRLISVISVIVLAGEI
jgi:hypothetical protein